jgi:hypothetical protein
VLGKQNRSPALDGIGSVFSSRRVVMATIKDIEERVSALEDRADTIAIAVERYEQAGDMKGLDRVLEKSTAIENLILVVREQVEKCLLIQDETERQAALEQILAVLDSVKSPAHPKVDWWESVYNAGKVLYTVLGTFYGERGAQ